MKSKIHDCPNSKMKVLSKTTKTTLTALSLFLMLGFISCKKQYSCSCKTTISTTGYSSSTESKESYSLKLKEKQAKAACDNTEEILSKQVKDQQQGLSTSVACELK
jgi:hypothetical protein